VKEVMSTSVITIGPHEPLANAARLMLEHKIGCLPVVDGEHRLAGIVTADDFVRWATVHMLPEEQLRRSA
jgi:CBS domain-containing protein